MDKLWPKKYDEGLMQDLNGTCNMCNKFVTFMAEQPVLRESMRCSNCGSWNRQRQLVTVLSKWINKDAIVYNTEASRGVHEWLRQQTKHYTCSEYFGPDCVGGITYNGARHEDLMDLSFESSKFDIVVSSDVLEHVPNWHKACREVYRVLKPGGKHIFTVPFCTDRYTIEYLVKFSSIDGSPIFLKSPLYHGDPISSKGALVFAIFGLEMMCDLEKMGFHTNIYHLYLPHLGIVGQGAIVFESIKI